MCREQRPALLRCPDTPPSGGRAPLYARTCLYLLIEDVTVCGRITPIILHGVVSPDSRLRAKREQRDMFGELPESQRLVLESQSQNLAFAVLFVPHIRSAAAPKFAN